MSALARGTATTTAVEVCADVGSCSRDGNSIHWLLLAVSMAMMLAKRTTACDNDVREADDVVLAALPAGPCLLG